MSDTASHLAKLALLAALGYGAWTFGPALHARYQVGREVEEALLTWRNTDRDTARRQLADALLQGSMAEQLTLDDCAMTEEAGYKRVRCVWTAEIEHIGGTTNLLFKVSKKVGGLHRGAFVEDDD